MNPTAVFSKSGKGVQEASGKTSHLSRADRAVLSAFDGRITVAEVAEKIGKAFDPKFEQLVEQLEKDGFVRQVSAGVSPVQPASRHGAPAKPAAPPTAAEELDFTIFAPPKASPARPAAPPVEHGAKSREEAERKAKEEHAASYRARQEIERARAEAEARSKAAAQARMQAEAAAKARMEAEAKGKADGESSARAKAAEAEAKVRAEAEAKVKAAREAAVRAAAEAKAKAEAELEAKLEAERAKAREDAERIRKEAEDKARREAEELRQRLEEERKAREEADAARRKAEQQAREEAERIRKEAEEKARREAEEKARREAEELRQRLEEERKAREEAEAARKKAEEQAREEERRRREEEERRARQEAERKEREEKERAEREKREQAERERQERAEREQRDRAEKERAEREKQERKEREREEQERAEREKQELREREEQEKAERERAEKAQAEREQAEANAAAPASAGGFSDSLLADLDTFGQREEEDKKARQEAEAAKKKAAQQARAEAERKAREEEERREKQEAERKAREAAELRAREEAGRRAKAEAKEAEEREAEERKRKARESVAAKAGAGEDDDIGVTDEDLDMDEVKRDQKALSQEARRAAREREREKEKERQRERETASREATAEATPAAPPRIRRPIKWGKPVAVALFVLLIAAIGAVHVMPISTADYEKAASDALGVPVKIGSARVSLFTGVQLKLDKVAVGDARIASARAFPAVGSLFGEKKTFSRIELDGVTVPQQAIATVLFTKAKGASFEVGRIVAQKVKLEGPLALPVVDADLRIGADGSVTAATVRGPENLNAKLEPKGSEVEFDVQADTFALPVAPEVALNQFGMKGVANARGMDIPAWSATLYDGVLSGTAKLSWGGTYSLDGVVTVRGMNVAVFAPALVSEGKVEGTGRFSMSGGDAAKLGDAARLEGNFNITKGVLGSIDISRAISTGGRQASGRTPFTELVGQGVYDKGSVQLRNITIGAGALNAGASADIAQGGALSGRIVADVRAASQTLRATLNLGGTVKEPQVRN